MQEDKSVASGSPGENIREYKGDNDANTATMEHFEIEPAPHLHLKTYLLVAVRLATSSRPQCLILTILSGRVISLICHIHTIGHNRCCKITTPKLKIHSITDKT